MKFLFFLNTEYWLYSNQFFLKKGTVVDEYIPFKTIKDDFKFALTHGLVIEQLKLEFDEDSPNAEIIEL